MRIKTPQFWTKKNFISFSLLPFGLIYLAVFYLKNLATKSKKISKPVICIGNLIAGGSGKTPVAMAIGKILDEDLNCDFAYLSCGYKGDGSKFTLLKKDDNNKAKLFGDEPLLLAEVAPTFVAKNRFFGASQIDRMKKFAAIILDDGLQNNSLHRDFNIVVVDGKIGFGNGFPIPAGPMRETLKTGLKKADLIVLIGHASGELFKILRGKNLVKARVVALNANRFSGKKLIAFCGLAYPQKFFSFLKNQKLRVVENHSFADHHFYSDNDLEKLCQIAKEKRASLITTKKDWIKFPEKYREKISYLDIELEFENRALITRKLKKILFRK